MNQLLQVDQTERPLRRRLAAIAFLDVVGYSRMMAVSEEATLRVWSDMQTEVIEPRIAARRGRVIDRAGDAIFAEFGSALDALHWAMDVQNAAARHADAGAPIRLRIALHLADVIDGPDGAVQGDGVNTTARLQAYAETGGVIVSRAFADAVHGKTDAGFTDLGLLRLKNIVRPVHAFRLRLESGSRPVALRWRSAARVVLPVLGVLLLGLLLSMIGGWHSMPRDRAERFLQQGLAISCTIHPCPREWLAKRALFEQAIAADPTFARPYAEAAFTYTNFVSSHLSTDRNDDLHIAARLATQAVALAPDHAFAHEARGEVLRQDPDRVEDALSAYFRSLAIYPNQPRVRANAGWMLVLLGRPAEAEPYLEAALAAAPTSKYASAWLNYLGLAKLFLGCYRQAADLFRRSIEQQLQDAVATDIKLERGLNLAAALALGGDIDAARTVVAGMRVQYPVLSARNILWNCDCSHAPAFLAGLTILRRGAELAGVLNAG